MFLIKIVRGEGDNMCICDNLFNNDEKQKKRDLGFFAFLDD